MGKKDILLRVISDSLLDSLHYNRQECEDLSVDDITRLVESGEVTIESLVSHIREELEFILNE